MKIRGLARDWKPEEFFPIKADRVFDQAADAKIPFSRIEAGRWSIAQYRKIFDQSLTRWKSYILPF